MFVSYFLKPMFWYMAKIKIYIFALFMQKFIELYEPLLPC